MVIETYTDANGDYMRWEGYCFYMSPDGTGWSNMPYTKDQKAYDRRVKRENFLADKIIEHLERTGRNLAQEHRLVLERRSTLNSACRTFLLERYNRSSDSKEARGFASRGTLVLPNE